MTSAASAMSMSVAAVVGSAVIHSAAEAAVRSAPDAAARSTSRSVRMPARRPSPSTTTDEPNRPLAMASATSATHTSPVTV